MPSLAASTWDPWAMLFLKGHEATARCLAFSADGRLLASAAETGKAVILWDGLSSRRRSSLAGHAHPITALAFAPGIAGRSE